jgi:hypothetical protein
MQTLNHIEACMGVVDTGFLPHWDPHLRGKGLYIPRGRRRTIPEGSTIHESVTRVGVLLKNLPKNIQTESWIKY